MDASKLTSMAEALFESAGTAINPAPPRYKVLGDIPPGDYSTDCSTKHTKSCTDEYKNKCRTESQSGLIRYHATVI